jgi:hypothetical protein
MTESLIAATMTWTLPRFRAFSAASGSHAYSRRPTRQQRVRGIVAEMDADLNKCHPGPSCELDAHPWARMPSRANPPAPHWHYEVWMVSF